MSSLQLSSPLGGVLAGTHHISRLVLLTLTNHFLAAKPENESIDKDNIRLL